MPELDPRHGLDHLAVPGRYGAPGRAGVELSLRTDLALATVMVRTGRYTALARRVRESFGVELYNTPRRESSGAIAFAWAGPGHWLASADDGKPAEFEQTLRNRLSDLASVTDQTGGRIVIRVSGARARDALAKGVLVDLHPRTFRPGDCAVTAVGHVGVHFWQVNSAPTFEFVVYRSLAVSFWEWLASSSAEFGVSVVAA